MEQFFFWNLDHLQYLKLVPQNLSNVSKISLEKSWLQEACITMRWQSLFWIFQFIKDPIDSLTFKKDYLNDGRLNILVSQNEMLSIRVAAHSRFVYWYRDILSVSLQSTVSLFFPVQIIVKSTWTSRGAWPCNLNTRAGTKVQNYHHFMFSTTLL